MHAKTTISKCAPTTSKLIATPPGTLWTGVDGGSVAPRLAAPRSVAQTSVAAFISSIKTKNGTMPFFDSGWVGFSPSMQKAIQMARATTKSAAQPPRQLRHLKTTLNNGQHRRSARGYHGNKPNEGGPSDRKTAWMERNKWALATNECIYHHTKRGCHKGDACQYNHSDNKPDMGSLNHLNYQQSEEVVRQLTKNMRKMSDSRN